MDRSFSSNPLVRSLAAFDTCTVANAIEALNVRLRNQGFANGFLPCRFPHLPPLIGHAVTIRVRTASPPIAGSRHIDHTDWWNIFEAIPQPRILVIEDADPHPGVGALVGEVHAHLFAALGTAGIVTNGAVRGLPAIESLGLGLFAGSVAVSRAYAHVVSVGSEVVVGDLAVRPGDLLHGDRHGLLNVPLSIADQIADVATKVQEQERKLIDLCSLPGVTAADLREAIALRDCLPGIVRAGKGA